MADKQSRRNKRTKRNRENIERTEYDDDCIYHQNPELRSDVQRRECLVRIPSVVDEIKSAKGDYKHLYIPGGDFLIQKKTDELLHGLKSSIACIQRVENEIAYSKREIAELKNDFKKLEDDLSNVSGLQSRTISTAQCRMREIDFVMYQNKVINHLIGAAEKIELHDTIDGDHIWFANPDNIGTDIDAIFNKAESRGTLELSALDFLIRKQNSNSQFEQRDQSN
ncbi:hypothetical protein DPMN_159555 [Dreissena polymorpha]|uniref:Uncharacterized protein n=1 Tax=Dreissena polymorpha TaxID=45954 RepID=A0A9D4IQS5_DREPO|nr:hypothetical protein DPMN_159555 [Dreissena polymorpha]